ncbi:MAG: SDR family oxidoreductase [Muribaculaceae bacterium]|nr:SDR family oxidoreductase [Muribaculaceae bacterium]
MLKVLYNKIRAFLDYIKYNGKITHISIGETTPGELLKGKKIIVTGGAKGIGLAIANKFLEQNAKVLITSRNITSLQNVKQSIGNKNLQILKWDVTDFSQTTSKIEEAITLLGGLDIIVNNAAFLANKQTDETFYDKTMDTNLKSIYFICKEAGERMSQLNGEKGGKIIIISSINGFMGSTHPYYISKWGLNGLIKGYAKEYAPKNIIVNGIAPGYCSSGINLQDIEKNAYFERNPLHRIILPEEVAELATFLASDLSNGIVGEIIKVDGGTTII